MKKILLSLLLASNLLSTTSYAQETTSTSQEASTAFDWQIYEEDLLEASEGRGAIETLFTSDQPLTFESDQVKFIIDGYSYKKISDTTANQSIKVLMIHVTYKNMSQEELMVTDTLYGKINGIEYDFNTVKPGFYDEKLNLFANVMERDMKLLPGEEVSGATFFAFDEEMEAGQLEENGQFILEAPILELETTGDISEKVMPGGKVALPISQEAVATTDSQSEFYGDKATVELMGTKTMLEEKVTNESDTENDITVTLNGYQWTEFTPNEDQKSRFENFKNGVVLLTVDLTIKNNQAETLRLETTSGVLTLNESFRVLNEYMLHLNETDKLIKTGEEGQHYVIFALSKDDYELYRERDVDLEINLYNEGFAKINQTDDYTFDIRDTNN